MTEERWAYDGPVHNIHVFEADRPHMRVCFMTSDGPTRERARLIAAAPDMLAALQAILAMGSMFDLMDAHDIAAPAVKKATQP